MATPEVIPGLHKLSAEGSSTEEPDLFQLPTGEIIDLGTVAVESIGNVLGKPLYGLLDLSRYIGADTAYNMYKQVDPNTSLNADWFEHHQYLAQLSRPTTD